MEEEINSSTLFLFYFRKFSLEEADEKRRFIRSYSCLPLLPLAAAMQTSHKTGYDPILSMAQRPIRSLYRVMIQSIPKTLKV